MEMNKNGKSMIIIIVAAVVLIAGLVGGMAIMKMKGSGKHKVEKKPVVMVPIGEFVVNLADTTEMRYVKTVIVLGVEGEMKAEGGEAKGEGEGGGASAPLRDAVIQALGSKSFSDLAKPNGKEELKKEIIASVNKRMEGAKAVEVFFNEFAMQ